MQILRYYSMIVIITTRDWTELEELVINHEESTRSLVTGSSYQATMESRVPAVQVLYF
jgi:hypothetical protein